MHREQTSSAWKGPPQCERCSVREQVLFSALDREAFALIGRPIDERRFGRGQRLYRVGDSPDYLFTVRAGLVKLTQYLPDGAQRIVRLVKPGDLIGLETLLGIPYGHDAVVLVPVLACLIPVEVIKYLDRRVPDLGRQLMERWQRALTETDSWLTEFATGSTQKRIARLLIHLVGDPGELRSPCLAPTSWRLSCAGRLPAGQGNPSGGPQP